MPSKSWLPMLVLGWVAVVVISGLVFWLVLRDEGTDEARPALPPIPEPVPIPQPVTPPTQTIPRRSHAGIEVEIGQLETILVHLKQQEMSQDKQREGLVSIIKSYGELIAKGDVKGEDTLTFFRKKNSEVDVKVAETSASLSEAETKHATLSSKLKQANEELRAQKVALDSPHGALATLKTVTALQNQIATLDCRIAAESDGLAWYRIQQAALSKVLSGQKEAVQPAIELLGKWQPPRKGITVLESQLKQLRAESDLLIGK